MRIMTFLNITYHYYFLKHLSFVLDLTNYHQYNEN
jgi:hypothetical protein